MSNVSSAVSIGTGGYDSYSVSSVSKPKSSSTVEGANREGDLTRQLDDRLSQQLARIRSQIGPNTSGTTSAEAGVGTVLDIRA